MYFYCRLVFAGVFALALNAGIAQNLVGSTKKFTRNDTLRGSITPERAWWDLEFYELDITVNPQTRSINGSNIIQYKVLNTNNLLQIDLQPPLQIKRVEQDGKILQTQQIGRNAYHIILQKKQHIGASERLKIWYGGKPKTATLPPWYGGFSWEKDETGNDFIATSCQRLGASVWWPCKDHPYDEPDSQRIRITVPEPLIAVANGRFERVIQNPDSSRTYQWFVANPINNYGVNLNAAVYTHMEDTLNGEKGVLSLDFFVLKYNLKKAQQHFQQTKTVLRAFEYWFGPYPFYEDGYKLVEAPYIGMEHQSSITYGNGYQNGHSGHDLSGSGWGLKWDYIIVHESAHEWFANNLTNRDQADMWIHESFATYSESLYTEYLFGKDAGAEYVRGQRRIIKNDKPIIPPYHVNADGSGDMYFKGANLLHMIRQIINDDTKWRRILRGLNQEFYHSTIGSEAVESYISRQAGIRFDHVFDQYLRDNRIPALEYRFRDKKLQVRWGNCIPEFDMPVKVAFPDGTYRFIYPGPEWSDAFTTNRRNLQLLADENFYITVRKL